MPDADLPLYPPTFAPTEQPLGRLAFLARCARNPLATIPAAAYREPSAEVVFNGIRTIWLSEPAALEDVLVTQAAQFGKTELEARLFAPVIGQGVLTADGSDWRWQRRVLAPLFRPGEVLTYVADMSTAAERQIAGWRAACGKRGGASTTITRAIDDDMTRATYDVIVRTMLYGGAPDDVDRVAS